MSTNSRRCYTARRATWTTIPYSGGSANGLRAVILKRPQPFRGAMLVKTVYRVQPAVRAH